MRAPMTTNLTINQDKILSLLSKGLPPSAVANALGIDQSYISQLMSDDEFAAEVSTRKYITVEKHLARDGAIDRLEDKILEKLEHSMAMMHRPMEILKAFSVINAAKRKATIATPADILSPSTQIINLQMPTIIQQHFTTNINNQVISAGTQNLITIQSNTLMETVKAAEVARLAGSVKEREHVTIGAPAIPSSSARETRSIGSPESSRNVVAPPRLSTTSRELASI